MKAEYMYCVKMPSVGVLHKTIGGSEREAIEAFSKFEPRLNWVDALKAGYRCVKILVCELK